MRPQAFYASPFKNKISIIFSAALRNKKDTAILILFFLKKINKSGHHHFLFIWKYPAISVADYIRLPENTSALFSRQNNYSMPIARLHAGTGRCPHATPASVAFPLHAFAKYHLKFQKGN